MSARVVQKRPEILASSPPKFDQPINRLRWAIVGGYIRSPAHGPSVSRPFLATGQISAKFWFPPWSVQQIEADPSLWGAGGGRIAISIFRVNEFENLRRRVATSSILNLVPWYIRLYENKRGRAVVQPRARRFTPILSDNGLVYGSRFFSIYLSLYYCIVHAYSPDESIV